jgi:hypothetical protein
VEYNNNINKKQGILVGRRRSSGVVVRVGWFFLGLPGMAGREVTKGGSW